MTAPRRLRVIWNSNAGRKGGLPTNLTGEDQLRDIMRQHALGDDLVASDSEETARRSTQEAVEAGYEGVVAAGGDGTVGMVADVLLGTDTALGVFPLGSVMNIARMLGLPRDLEGAAATLARGVARQVDVGVANGHLFYENASVGMNAAMFKYATQFTEGDFGSVRRMFWLALRYRPARMDLTLDGEHVRMRGLMVTVSNGPYTGVAMTVAPAARVDDGKLDVTVFRHFSKLELLRHLASISFGRRAYTPHTRTYRAQRVVVESRRRLPCRADSIDLGSTPLECTVRRAALRVVAPLPEAPSA